MLFAGLLQVAEGPVGVSQTHVHNRKTDWGDVLSLRLCLLELLKNFPPSPTFPLAASARPIEDRSRKPGVIRCKRRKISNASGYSPFCKSAIASPCIAFRSSGILAAQTVAFPIEEASIPSLEAAYLVGRTTVHEVVQASGRVLPLAATVNS
jgi:hypothetical protein